MQTSDRLKLFVEDLQALAMAHHIDLHTDDEDFWLTAPGLKVYGRWWHEMSPDVNIEYDAAHCKQGSTLWLAVTRDLAALFEADDARRGGA